MSHTIHCTGVARIYHPSAITRARLRREDALVARHVNGMSRVHSVGGIIVSPSEVQARLVALDANWTQLSQDVLGAIQNPALPPGQASTFQAFGPDLSAWQAFFAANKDTFWTAGSVNDQAGPWQQKASDWQAKLSSVGVAPSGPVIPPPKDPTDPFAGLGATVKWVAIALGAVVVLVILKDLAAVGGAAKALVP